MIKEIRRRMKRRKEFIGLGEAKQLHSVSNMTYKTTTLFKKVCAYSLITYGVVTLPLPTGSQLALLGGCALLGISYKMLLNTIVSYIEFVYSWVCRNVYLTASAYNVAKFERGCLW